MLRRLPPGQRWLYRGRRSGTAPECRRSIPARQLRRRLVDPGTSRRASRLPCDGPTPPKGTLSFVLILHDPDAHIPKAPTDITHWVVFNIPGDSTQLPESVPPDAPLANGGLQGTNVTGKASYQGPCAPPGNPHHYTCELLALDQKLDLPQGATRDQIQKAMEGHVLGSAVYIGLFNR